MPFSALYNFFASTLTPSEQVKRGKGLLRAIVDAIFGQDNEIGGQAITRTTLELNEATTTTVLVESVLRFGYKTDGTTISRFQINDEIIEAAARVETSGAMAFTTLTRGVDDTPVSTHPAGSLVFDLSWNTSAIDLARRGFSVNTARLADLDVIGSNLGLHRCSGMSEEAWRRFIKAVAYSPKGTIEAVDAALEAYFGNTNDYSLHESPVVNPHLITIEVLTALVSGVAAIRGRKIVTGNQVRATTGLTTVTTPHPIRQVFGVFLSTKASRRGARAGLTNYYASHVGSTITLSPSPGAIGTQVVVDYQGWNGTNDNAHHYLAYGFGADAWITPTYPSPQTVRDDNDRWAYLSDPLAIAKCILDQVRPVGTGFIVKAKS